MCDIFSEFEKLSQNDTEAMELKTGGWSAVPTKENDDRSGPELFAEIMRRLEEEREENIRSVKHEADQNDSNSKLSLRHSKHEKVETEKKPMMARDDEKNQNETVNHDNDEDESNNNRQKLSDTIERSHHTCQEMEENSSTNQKEGFSRLKEWEENRIREISGKEDEDEDEDEKVNNEYD